MASKNTICLWYDGTALDAARFYAERYENPNVISDTPSITNPFRMTEDADIEAVARAANGTSWK